MAYIKKDMFVSTTNPVIQDEMIECLRSKEDLGLKKNKIMQLVYQPVPMSKLRWSKYFNSVEMARFLVLVDAEETEEVVDDIKDTIDEVEGI